MRIFAPPASTAATSPLPTCVITLKPPAANHNPLPEPIWVWVL
ncbi:Uncharacterised protein [Vibrio cholerae]|nr:Uncharacterised protein [Vibrio cholerae]